MEKEFIPYEQALALKELGFNEPCLACVGENNEVIIRVGDYRSFSNKKPEDSIERDFYNNIIKDFNSYVNDTASAPLYQQAFRWLLILVNKDEYFSNKWTISYNEDYYSLFLGGCNMSVFKTELECLKKLIEIVKENVDKQR
jgi:hypothetical protein